MAGVETADGLQLAAEAHGAGLPVVLSPALCTTRENWRPQVEPLVAAGARVILWDYRGHGGSDAPDDPHAYAMTRVVDDLARVADWGAPGESVVLVGLSFGGLASLHLALRSPERVRALVLLNSGPGFKNPEAQARWEATVERTAARIERRGPASLVEGSAAATTIGGQPELPAARAAARAIAAQDPVGLCHFARRVAARAEAVLEDLARIDAPALVLVGERDDAYRRAAEVMASRLPRAESAVIPDAGHIANIEQSAAVDAALIRFLRKLPAQESP